LAAEDDALALAAQDEAARLETELGNLTDGPQNGTGEMQRHFMGNRAVATMDALESIGHHLSGVPKRKNLIWVSSGFPVACPVEADT
jgi:hypothetical protein